LWTTKIPKPKRRRIQKNLISHIVEKRGKRALIQILLNQIIKNCCQENSRYIYKEPGSGMITPNTYSTSIFEIYAQNCYSKRRRMKKYPNAENIMI
jgi:hypothetical protein